MPHAAQPTLLWVAFAAGLQHLEPLTRPHTLDLDFTEITDAGIPHLSTLRELKLLKIFITPITGEGVKKLQAALPNCRIACSR